MNKAGGYVWLHRKILDWEWYKDPVTRGLFLHLLVVANFTDAKFMGKKIKRGQFVTSLAELSKQTGFSVQQVKTALKHLILTNEITNQSTRKYRIITIVKYNEYQCPTNQLTNNQQTANKQLTNSQQQYNKNNNDNKGIKKEREAFTPPSLEEVKTFCKENGIRVDAERFYYHYESVGWMVGKAKMKNWKATIRKWEVDDKNGRSGQGESSGDTGKVKKHSELYDTVIRL